MTSRVAGCCRSTCQFNQCKINFGYQCQSCTLIVAHSSAACSCAGEAFSRRLACENLAYPWMTCNCKDHHHQDNVHLCKITIDGRTTPMDCTFGNLPKREIIPPTNRKMTCLKEQSGDLISVVRRRQRSCCGLLTPVSGTPSFCRLKKC